MDLLTASLVERLAVFNIGKGGVSANVCCDISAVIQRISHAFHLRLICIVVWKFEPCVAGGLEVQS